MKVEIPKELVSDLVDELADTREAVKDKDKEKWDRTPLGLLYTVLTQTRSARSGRAPSPRESSLRNRISVKRSFKLG